MRCLVALCSNNAKSCYDQITLLAMALCLCHLGGSQPMVQSMITMIHKIEHHICTTFGDSKISALHATWQAPIAGIGQGNGAGPHIWAAVSSPILDIMQKEGFYVHLIMAILCMEKLVGFAFVNDTNLCIFCPQVTNQNVQEEMQKSVNQWEGLLRTMGGALVPTKCFWYLIDFRYTNNKQTYVTKSQYPRELVINDEHQHRVTIL